MDLKMMGLKTRGLKIIRTIRIIKNINNYFNYLTLKF